METDVTHQHKTSLFGWKNHFFDFFMPFLAVRAGLFVNNMRDRISAANRGKEFILSMTEDLSQDIYDLDSIITARKVKEKMMDSLFELLHAPIFLNMGMPSITLPGVRLAPIDWFLQSIKQC